MADAFFTFLGRDANYLSVESLCICSPNTYEFGNAAPSILCLAVGPLTFLVDHAASFPSLVANLSSEIQENPESALGSVPVV